jgi:hypothetical protein
MFKMIIIIINVIYNLAKSDLYAALAEATTQSQSINRISTILRIRRYKLYRLVFWESRW